MNSILRVAQIAPLFESIPPKTYGGTERVVDNLTKGLLKLGVDVTVFCSGDSVLPHGAKSEFVWPESLRLSSKAILDPGAYQTRMIGAVAKRAGDFDLLHNHYDYGLLPLVKMTNTPLVTTIHGRMDMPDLNAAFEHFHEAPLISISRAQQAPLPHLNWLRNIPHGIDIGSFKFHEKPGKYLAFLGRFCPEKKAEWAIEIALRSGVPLKIAAKIEPKDMDYYENIIKPKIDGKFIEYVGEIGEHEKSEFLGNALALAFPIHWPEPFGLVMIEAMACGTPVLGRPMGSVPEVLEDGVTGFVRSNIYELSDLVPSLEKLDRRKIRSEAEKRFSIERMAQEYLNVYRELCEAKQTYSGRMAEYRRNLLHSLDGSLNRNSQSIA